MTRSLRLAALCAVAVAPLAACATLDAERVALPARPAQSVDAGVRRPDVAYAAAVQAIDRRDYAAALDLLHAARQQTPDDVRVLNALGVVYDKLGRFDLSARYYGQAAKADPASSVVQANITYSRRLQSQVSARELMAQAPILKADPEPAAAEPSAPPTTTAAVADVRVTIVEAAPTPRQAPAAVEGARIKLAAGLGFAATAPRPWSDTAAVDAAKPPPAAAPAMPKVVATAASPVVLGPADQPEARRLAPVAGLRASHLATLVFEPPAQALPPRAAPARGRTETAPPAASIGRTLAAVGARVMEDPLFDALFGATIKVEGSQLRRAAAASGLRIVNASGRLAWAEPVRSSLAGLGWSTPRAVAAAPQVRSQTIILYRPDHERVAKALARTLPGAAQLRACAEVCGGVELILGSDARTWRRLPVSGPRRPTRSGSTA